MKRGSFLAILLLVTLLAFGASLVAGKVWISPFGLVSGTPEALIMAELRLPRALLGLGIGAMLGASGAVLQGYLRNPLADPGLLGISASAALGAVLAIFLGLAASPFIVSAFGMAGALGAMLLLALMAGRSASAISFILAGVVLSSLAGALTALLINLAPTPFALGEIVTWLMGALTDRSLADALRVLPFVGIGLLLLAPTGRALDALALGEAAARSLGVDPWRTRLLVIAGTGLGVGAGVAVTGVVGFVGLIVPHILRPFVGERPSDLIFPSALGGAALLLLADAAVRLAPGPVELKLGIAMSLIGAPFFLFLLWRHRESLP
ncbi:FecCD family ABC transporter permease [Sandaracinobacteroides sp. A072]|uniref:FecCD family ABC transporter permease n=1 Tax=Sandaracinobacteroides sp. A072 TaxID=3461146 RepID=UPI00404377DC